jgi:hypothetical protein
MLDSSFDVAKVGGLAKKMLDEYASNVYGLMIIEIEVANNDPAFRESFKKNTNARTKHCMAFDTVKRRVSIYPYNLERDDESKVVPEMITSAYSSVILDETLTFFYALDMEELQYVSFTNKDENYPYFGSGIVLTSNESGVDGFGFDKCIEFLSTYKIDENTYDLLVIYPPY